MFEKLVKSRSRKKIVISFVLQSFLPHLISRNLTDLQFIKTFVKSIIENFRKIKKSKWFHEFLGRQWTKTSLASFTKYKKLSSIQIYSKVLQHFHEIFRQTWFHESFSVICKKIRQITLKCAFVSHFHEIFQERHLVKIHIILAVVITK